MDPAPDTRRQLGQLMVEEGLLSADELAHALKEHSETGKPLGETLVALGYASPGAVANALAEQHGGLLRTEYGVSTGLRSGLEDERPALHAAPSVSPPSAPASGEPAHEPGAPLGAGLRLARPGGATAPPEAPAAAPAPAPAAAAPTAPAPAPAPAEEQPTELAKFASLHADLDAARTELEQKSTHLSELTGRLDETVSQLRASQTARDAFAAKAAELQAQAEAVPEPDPVEAARVQALEQSVADLQAQLIEAAQAAAQPDPAASARIEELEAQLQSVAADRAALEAKLSEAEAPAAPDPELTARVQELEAQLAARAAEPVPVQYHSPQVARMQELEAQLQAATVERDGLAQSLAELQTRLGATAQAREAEVARANAVAAARVTAVESQLQAAEVERNALARNVEVLQGLYSGTVAAHEAALAQVEEQLAARDQGRTGHDDELAAIEREHQVALDQLELERDVLAERFDELQRLMNETTAAHEAAFAKLEEQLVTVEPDATEHVLLVPASTGYVLLERSGPAPEARAVVEIGHGSWGEGRFVVSRIGPSPLPNGPRYCAFLERA